MLTRALRTLAAEPLARQALGSAAREYVASHHTLEQALAATSCSWKTLSNGRGLYVSPPLLMNKCVLLREVVTCKKLLATYVLYLWTPIRCPGSVQ